jgi:hypothetical protein
MRLWRRQHGPTITANVSERGGSTALQYRATVWQIGRDTLVCELPRLFTHLQAAQAAADDAVRRRFTHQCDFELCGEWTLCDVPAMSASVGSASRI